MRRHRPGLSGMLAFADAAARWALSPCLDAASRPALMTMSSVVPLVTARVR